MNPRERLAIRTAVEKRRKDETFEKSLGRTLRNMDMDYETYILLIAEVREHAKRKKMTLSDAALDLALKEEQ